MRLLSFCFVFVLPMALGHAENPDWNQWRGPSRDSQLSEATWPDAFKGKLNLVWEKPHAPSYSGPITQDGVVFTTETIDKKTERVTAYDLASGDMVWKKEWPGAMAVPFFAASNGDWIRSTPAVSGDHLLVLGMRDVLVCLDPKTGNEKWRVDFPAAMGTPLPAFGACCSPLIDGDAAYVQTGGALVKIALKDGSVVWNSLEDSAGMMSSGAFSSPIIATLAGQRQLVVQTRQEMCGVDLATGSVYWSQPIESFRGMNILTPVIIGDRIFNTAHSGKAQMFEVSRADDGKWSVAEVWNQKSQGY
ncbi:MAG: PQQ-binding-like beta-propeller repeat protein, partial [Rubripirellula sp.]